MPIEWNGFFSCKLKNHSLYSKIGKGYDDIWNIATPFLGDSILEHSKDVENNIFRLLSAYDISDSVPIEMLYILTVACAFHDSWKNNQPNFTDPHEFVSADIFSDCKIVTCINTEKAIRSLIKVHTSGDFDNMEADDEIIINRQKIYLPSCVALFRLADMMSTTKDRAIPRDGYVDVISKYRKTKPPSEHEKNQCRDFIEDYEINTIKREIRLLHVKGISSGNYKRLKNYTREALNDDFTPDHQRYLAQFMYYKKHETKKECLSLPKIFVLEPLKNQSKFTECFFHIGQTNSNIYELISKSIDDEKKIDTKFSYWSLAGTIQYMNICNDPSYVLHGDSINLLKSSLVVMYEKFASFAENIHLIDMGPGFGEEPLVILTTFIENNRGYGIQEFHLDLLDTSYHMLREAMRYIFAEDNKKDLKIKELIKKDKIKIRTINCDFEEIDLWVREGVSPYDSNYTNLFFLLGGTIGNLNENMFFNKIKEIVYEDKNHFILGIDLIGGRTNDEITDSYDNSCMKEFCFNSLKEIKTHKYIYDERKFDIFIDDEVTLKLDSTNDTSENVIVKNLIIKFDEIQLVKSTKYDFDTISKYFKNNFDFKEDHGVDYFINDDRTYAIFLLGKKNR